MLEKERTKERQRDRKKERSKTKETKMKGPWWPSGPERQSITARMDRGVRGSNPTAACLDLFSDFFRRY